MHGLTLDTGALIALERRNRRAAALVDDAKIRGFNVTVPTIVVSEWWRGQSGRMTRLLRTLSIEPLSLRLAQIVGAALSRYEEPPGLAGIIVMASAASRGDVVFTSDFDDLHMLHDHFRAVASVLRV
jgi:hypothetical protein